MTNSAFPFAQLRRLYEWVIGWADTPYGTWALFFIAVAEASFFPVPPDVLLIALAVGAPRRALRFALVCGLGSVVGAAAGYLIGFHFYGWIGRPIIEFYGFADRYTQVKDLYDEWDAVAVMIAGFSPIPFKVFTIAAGTFRIDFVTFLLASAASRTARFCLLGWLIRLFGPGIRHFIDRYFNILTVVFLVLLLGGFMLLQYVI